MLQDLLFQFFATEDRLFLIGNENQSILPLLFDDENWIYSNDGLPNIDLVNFGLETQRELPGNQRRKAFLYEPSRIICYQRILVKHGFLLKRVIIQVL